MTKGPEQVRRTKGPRYTPVSKRQDKPDGIAWIIRNHPEISDGAISNLIGTTRTTIAAAEFTGALTPFVVVPLAALVYKERTRLAPLTFGLVSLGGLAIVLFNAPESGEFSWEGVLWIAAATTRKQRTGVRRISRIWSPGVQRQPRGLEHAPLRSSSRRRVRRPRPRAAAAGARNGSRARAAQRP